MPKEIGIAGVEFTPRFAPQAVNRLQTHMQFGQVLAMEGFGETTKLKGLAYPEFADFCNRVIAFCEKKGVRVVGLDRHFTGGSMTRGISVAKSQREARLYANALYYITHKASVERALRWDARWQLAFKKDPFLLEKFTRIKRDFETAKKQGFSDPKILRSLLREVRVSLSIKTPLWHQESIGDRFSAWHKVLDRTQPDFVLVHRLFVPFVSVMAVSLGFKPHVWRGARNLSKRSKKMFRKSGFFKTHPKKTAMLRH